MPNLIGTAPNQVPTNGSLGNMAFQNKEAVSVDTLVTTALTVTGTGALTVGGTQIVKDASGNVGLGVVPSAWGSSWKAFEQVGGSVWSYNFQNLSVSQNAYHNGTSFIYKNTSAATSYQQSNGVHLWFTAPSGTAGNAISFTQAMTLDASGSLLIGKTSSFGSQWTIQSNNAAAADNRIQLTHSGTGGTSSDGLLVGIIGTDAYVQNFESGPLILGTSGTERARIDSSGNLLVGTTSASVFSSASATGHVIEANGTAQHSRSGFAALLLNRTSSDGSIVEFFRGGSLAGSISVTATNTAYNTSSDARLKHDIIDAPEASDLIDAIKVRSFKWNADNSEQRYGMVAQELLEVAPEAVSVPADEEAMMGVDYSKLVPMLVKEVQSLRARVAQLEGN